MQNTITFKYFKMLQKIGKNISTFFEKIYIIYILYERKVQQVRSCNIVNAC